MKRARKRHVEVERRWAVVYGDPPAFHWDWTIASHAATTTVLFSSRADARAFMASNEGPGLGRIVRVEVTVREI